MSNITDTVFHSIWDTFKHLLKRTQLAYPATFTHHFTKRKPFSDIHTCYNTFQRKCTVKVSRTFRCRQHQVYNVLTSLISPVKVIPFFSLPFPDLNRNRIVWAPIIGVCRKHGRIARSFETSVAYRSARCVLL